MAERAVSARPAFFTKTAITRRKCSKMDFEERSICVFGKYFSFFGIFQAGTASKKHAFAVFVIPRLGLAASSGMMPKEDIALLQKPPQKRMRRMAFGQLVLARSRVNFAYRLRGYFPLFKRLSAIFLSSQIRHKLRFSLPVFYLVAGTFCAKR